MKKEDLDTLAGLYESVYSPEESGEYLEEQGGRGSSSASQTNQSVSGAQLLYGPSGKPKAPSSRPTNVRGGGTRPARPTAAPTQSRFAGARDAAIAKARQIKGSPVVGPKPTERPTAPALATAKPSAAPAAKPAATMGSPKVAPSSSSSTTPAAPKKTFNPLMQKTFGYQTGYAPDQIKNNAKKMAVTGSLKNISQSYEWPSAKTIRDIADAYSSIYEAKKKDQDQDGDNDFADVRIARMIASGMSKAEAIAAVKNKSYNEETELDEATRMRKELGKEGETSTRKELAARSKAFKRSGSVDKTIAAAERAADWSGDEKKARTLRGLAAARRGSVRDKPRAGMSGYAAKVEGSDKELQTSRQKAMSAGTLTPKEKKQMGEEYTVYEIVASYLLENNFAETLNDANAIIENMSENWLDEILSEKYWIKGAIKKPGAFTKKAKEHGMSTSEFAAYVDKHPEKFPTKTERQANLAQTLRKFK